MIGAIAGDIIGSVYELETIKTTNFPLFSPRCSFTDDSVLTVALAESILTCRDYGEMMKEYYALYPDAGYGDWFSRWASSIKSMPYYSWGNGAAMRISPVGFVFDTLEETQAKAEEYTAITHNHPDGIKGAQATASAIFMARVGNSKDEIREYIFANYGYDLSKTCDEIRRDYKFDESCQGTVPQAITAFMESIDFENAIRLAVSLGGDTDTLTGITGGIAQAYYGFAPEIIQQKVYQVLDNRLGRITRQFMEKF